MRAKSRITSSKFFIVSPFANLAKPGAAAQAALKNQILDTNFAGETDFRKVLRSPGWFLKNFLQVVHWMS
jgi:hypothetical protein